ncbi:MAG: protein kinase [Sandaracinaceae bacterium]|nr:protein kinase [Sandaracinaceae bacterium]
MVHRDLKLANVIVDPASGARVLDFGVATLLDPLRDHEVGGVVGTPEYMAPEQISGDGPIGPWTDLYAFGVMLAWVVRGGSPFADYESLPGLLIGKSTHVPPDQPPVRPGLRVPRAMQDLVERLLRPHPRARPRFAVEVAAELSALLSSVEDAVRQGAVLERADSVQPTTVEPSHEDEDPVERSAALELPAFLSAPADLALGAGVARLREVPMVGRAEERAELAALVEEVVETGQTRLLAYVGEAGIGKSRLARWGLAYVEQTGTMDGAAGGYDPSGADVAGACATRSGAWSACRAAASPRRGGGWRRSRASTWIDSRASCARATTTTPARPISSCTSRTSRCGPPPACGRSISGWTISAGRVTARSIWWRRCSRRTTSRCSSSRRCARGARSTRGCASASSGCCATGARGAAPSTSSPSRIARACSITSRRSRPAWRARSRSASRARRCSSCSSYTTGGRAGSSRRTGPAIARARAPASTRCSWSVPSPR